MRHLTLVAVAGLAIGGLCVSLAPAGPSGGDLADQQPKHPVENVPPAPIRSWQEELKTFNVPKGFHLELVAAEPLVEDPVAFSWDGDGRMYVVEMRGMMNDFAGTDEPKPVGQIKLLEDTNGDGVMDKATVFLDGLVMPRAVAACKDGVIVGESPNIYFCRSTRNDGKCDDKKLIGSDYGVKTLNPEHNANGLMYNIDNWYYGPHVYRLRPGRDKGNDTWIKEGPPEQGQWGISHDDIGRLYTNSNSSFLHCDLLPAQALMRNPFFESKAGLNVGIYDSNAVYPARVNPGVNRGYRDGQLKPDGKLATVTAACAPCIYRGDNWPAEYRGQALACEPAGNLIARFAMTQKGLSLRATNQHPDGLDFLTSTDERFRPVNLYTGPDGCLYIVDLYRGVLQHRTYLTAYLRDQSEKRGLINGIHLGRIWRLVADGTKPYAIPRMSTMKSDQLVAYLSSPNGTLRDTAQRLLVERADPKSVSALKDLAGAGADKGLGPLHAIWTLHGMGKLDSEALLDALDHKDARVRAAAVRLAGEMWTKEGGGDLLEKVVSLAKDTDPQVQVTLVMALSTSPRPEAMKVVADLLRASNNDPLMRDAAISGIAGRELEFFAYVMADKSWQTPEGGRPALYQTLARCVIAGRSAERIVALFDVASKLPAGSWQQLALLQGAADGLPKGDRGNLNVRPIRLKGEPTSVAALSKITDKKVEQALAEALTVVTWTGKPGDKPSLVPPLTAAEEKRFNDGKTLFQTTCAVCHQPSGLGMEGTAPPLFGSDWVVGSPDRVIRIALHGLKGPVVVNKKTYELEMPDHKALTDEQIAGLLTYIRREWGHEATAISPEQIAAVRKETSARSEAFTAKELLAIK